MIARAFGKIWTFLWEDRVPVLFQIAAWLLVLFLSTQIEGRKSADERRTDAIVAQVNTVSSDATTFNVLFSEFAFSIMQKEFPHELVQSSTPEERQRARAALLDNLVRQQADADAIEALHDPAIDSLVQKYEAEIQTNNDLARTVNDFDALKPAFKASARLMAAQQDIILALKKKAGLSS